MKKQIDQTKKGILLAFLTSIISGIAIFYAKIAVVKIDPLVLTTSRNIVAAMLLVISYWLLGKKQELKNLKKNELGQLLLIGVIGGGLPFFLFFSGLQMVGAQTANLIHKTLFIWVSLLADLFLGEKFNLTYAVSFVLIFIGNFYFAKLPLTFGKGEWMILTATVLWSIENILAKKVLRNVSSELVSLFRMGIGLVIL
jgi:drug/metabolite transporter (DMT)-like permease